MDKNKYRPFLESLEYFSSYQPDKIAVQSIGNDAKLVSLTYKELLDKVNAFAQLLQSLKVRPQDRILILTESSPYALVALLACWRANVIAVPVDPSFPEDIIKGYATRIQAVAVCVSDWNISKGKNIFLKELPIINIEQQKIINADRFTSISMQPVIQASENVVLMLFTSGTTGAGKAVMYSQNNLLATVNTYISIANAATEENLFAPLPTHHIYMIVHGYLTVITSGATLTCLGVINPIILKTGIWLSQPSILLLVPPILNAVYRDIESKLAEISPWKRALIYKMADFALFIQKKTNLNLPGFIFSTIVEKFGYSVRMLVCGGAPLNKDICYRLQSFGLPVADGVGISETTANIFTIRSALSEKFTDRSLQTGVKIINKDQDGIGEITYSGPQLMLGYFNDPEKTNEVIKDGVFYTGDLAKEYPDGSIEFIGRSDDLIITTGGGRVSPNEIEALYEKASSAVQEFAVFGMQVGNSKQVHVAIVIKPEFSMVHNIQEDVTKSFALVSAKLPEDFIIRKLHFVDSLPKANRFKTKYKLLPEWVKQKSHDFIDDDPLFEPHDEDEKKILEIAQELFKGHIITRTDYSFYALGMESLITMELETEIAYQLSLPGFTCRFDKDFIANPTVQTLAVLVKKYRSENKDIKKEHTKKTNAPYETRMIDRVLLTIFQGIAILLLPMLIFLPLKLLIPGFKMLGDIGFFFIPVGYSLWFILNMLLFVLFKWIIIGRFKKCQYDIYSTYYYRFWLVKNYYRIILVFFTPMLVYINETYVLTAWYKLLGAKIGKGSMVKTFHFFAWDLLTIGENSFIDDDVYLSNNKIRNGKITLDNINIGSNSKVSSKTMVDIGSIVPDNSRVKNFTSYPLDGCQQDNTVKIEFPLWYVGAQLILSLFVLPYVLLFPVALGYFLSPNTFFLFNALCITYVAYLVVSCSLKWILLGKISPMKYKAYGWYALRKWIVGRVLQLSELLLVPLYGLNIYSQWLRLCGVKVGKGNMILSYYKVSAHGELLEIGDENLMSSPILATDRVIENDFIIQEKIVIGNCSSLSRNSFVKGGVVIEDYAQVGPQTIVENNTTVHSNQIKLGKETAEAPYDILSYARPPEKYARKLERLNFLIYTTILVILFIYSILITQIITYFAWSDPVLNGWIIYWSSKLFFIIYLILASDRPEIAGKYRLWTKEMYKSQIIWFPMQRFLPSYALVDIVGTEFYNIFLRLNGAKIGTGVIINSQQIGNYDLLNIGDYTVIDEGAIVVGHMMVGNLYGNFILGPNEIGKFCSVAPHVLLLPETKLHDCINIDLKDSPIYFVVY